jgi:hypothetical protein
MSTCVLVVLGAVLLLVPAQTLGSPGASLTPGAVPVSHVESAQLGGATYGISGTVLDYSGNPASGAAVGWGWMPPGYELDPLDAAQFGGGALSAGGQFSFANVSSHPGNDFLWVEYEAADLPPQWLASWAYDFSTNNQASSYRYSVQPAAVDIQIANPPVAFDPQVDVYGTAGMAQSFPSLFSGVGLVPVAPRELIVRAMLATLANLEAHGLWPADDLRPLARRDLPRSARRDSRWLLWRELRKRRAELLGDPPDEPPWTVIRRDDEPTTSSEAPRSFAGPDCFSIWSL